MRNLKGYGLALIAVCLINAGTVSSAAANQFHSASLNTTWTPQGNVTQAFRYETAGKTVECSTISGDAVTNAMTVASLTFSPTYNGCTVKGIEKSSAEVKMNNCDYLLTIEAAANQGPLHVKCPAGKHIEITVKVLGLSPCTYHIVEQTPTGKADYSNSIATRIDVEPTQTMIAGTRQGSAECGAATSNTGSYTGRVELMGQEIGGMGNATAVQVG